MDEGNVVPFFLKRRESCGMCGQPFSASEDRLKELQGHSKTLDELTRTFKALTYCIEFIMKKQGKIVFTDDVLQTLEMLKREGVMKDDRDHSVRSSEEKA